MKTKKLIQTIIPALICGMTFIACSTDKTESNVKSSECDILYFTDSINLVNWVINGAEITAEYPAKTDLSMITPHIEVSGKATLSPQSGVKTDFSNEKEVVYTVTAEDGAIKIYKAHAKVATEEAPSDNAEYLLLIKNILECMQMPRPNDSYNYPVYPGMAAWAQLKTSEEMTEACQVPVDILKTMTTQAVLQALWEYPFLIMVLHRSQYQLDFTGTVSKTNAYNELIKRSDAGSCLLFRLLALNPVHSMEGLSASKSFEVLMSQTELLSQLTKEEKSQLIAVTLKNDDIREKNKSIIPNYYRETAWLLAGKTLINAGYTPFMERMNENESLKMFLESPSYTYIAGVYDVDVPQIIVEYAEEYLASIGN